MTCIIMQIWVWQSLFDNPGFIHGFDAFASANESV